MGNREFNDRVDHWSGMNETKLEEEPHIAAGETHPTVFVRALWLWRWIWVWVDYRLINLWGKNAPENNGDNDVESHRNFSCQHSGSMAVFSEDCKKGADS